MFKEVPLKAGRLRAAVEREGVGVHLGEPGRIRLEPAAWGTGLVAVFGGETVAVKLSSARTEPGSTVLVGGSAELRTPEHLLAALVGCGITDARLVASGPEVPVLDGSAGPWCAAIADAGVERGPRVAVLELAETVRVEAFGGVAEAWPSVVARVEVAVDFGVAGPRGSAAITLGGDGFASEVSSARTFALQADVDRLRASGRGRGATLDNTVVWGSDGPLNPLRMVDEPVRHKLVDLVGDLALLGQPFVGRVRVDRGSHRLHHALVAAMLEVAKAQFRSLDGSRPPTRSD